MLGMNRLQFETPGMELQKELCLWYFDRWLPIVAKKEFYGEDIRYYQQYTAKMNVNGKQKVAVTVTSEAFGLVMLENCRDKWLNIFELKKKDPKAKIPSKKEDTDYDKYKAKWSDGKCGQVHFGGWDPAAFEFLSEQSEKIHQLRQLDAADANNKAKYYLDLMRKEHSIGETAPTGKKKRGKQEIHNIPPKEKKIRRLDE